MVRKSIVNRAINPVFHGEFKEVYDIDICIFNGKLLKVSNACGSCVHTVWKCSWGSDEFYMISRDNEIEKYKDTCDKIPLLVIQRAEKAIRNKEYKKVYKKEYKETDCEIWSWNETDDESWSHGTFKSREEAIEDALGNIEEIKSYLETDTPTIHLGRCEYVPLPTSVDSERILFDLDEQYCSETGCENYIYEDVTDEQTKWLEDKLSDLMFEFHKIIGLNPCWFTVVEQEQIDLCEYEKENK